MRASSPRGTPLFAERGELGRREDRLRSPQGLGYILESSQCSNHPIDRAGLVVSLSRLAGKLVLRATGWKVQGHFPNVPKAVLVSAPHTSNWDFVYMFAIGLAEGVHPGFVAKHTLFWGPLGWLLRAMGGIPIRRHVRSNTVAELSQVFSSRSSLILSVPPEGTRSRVEYWKSGFYHIAQAADVDVILGYLDYANKRGGFGPVLRLSGDRKADMDQVRAFYSGIQGRRPQNFGPIRLKNESTDS